MRRKRRKGKRGRMSERKVWKVEREVWRAAWWVCSPEEVGRRGQTGNEREDEKKETDRVRASGTNLKEEQMDDKQKMTTEGNSWRTKVTVHKERDDEFK